MKKQHDARQYQVGPAPKFTLIPYDQTKGTRFEIYRKEGLWYWRLYLAYSPHGPVACSGSGYRTRQTAEGTISTALKAMRGVVQT